MVSPRIAPRPENYAAASVTDEVACAQITGPRIHIWSFDEGEQAAEIQVPRFSPEIPRYPRRRLQHLNIQRHLIRRPTLRLFRAEADRAWATAIADA
jgi:hypothetical protein